MPFVFWVQPECSSHPMIKNESHELHHEYFIRLHGLILAHHSLFLRSHSSDYWKLMLCFFENYVLLLKWLCFEFRRIYMLCLKYLA